MKKILCLVLVAFLCTACTSSKELVDYPELNKVVNEFVEELKESKYFEDINYSSIDEFSFDNGEKGYDVFYETNCSKITLSYSEDLKYFWLMLNKEDVCKDKSFSDSVWQEQINHILSFDEFIINESKFPGNTGDTWDDYNNQMNGIGEMEIITTNDGIAIGYDPDLYMFFIGKE